MSVKQSGITPMQFKKQFWHSGFYLLLINLYYSNGENYISIWNRSLNYLYWDKL